MIFYSFDRYHSTTKFIVFKLQHSITIFTTHQPANDGPLIAYRSTHTHVNHNIIISSTGSMMPDTQIYLESVLGLNIKIIFTQPPHHIKTL